MGYHPYTTAEWMKPLLASLATGALWTTSSFTITTTHNAPIMSDSSCRDALNAKLHSTQHSCQVSRNDRDSPGIFAFVPGVSWLTQKADNVPDISQTLRLGAYRWHLLSQQKLISLVVLYTEPLVVS